MKKLKNFFIPILILASINFEVCAQMNNGGQQALEQLRLFNNQNTAQLQQKYNQKAEQNNTKSTTVDSKQSENPSQNVNPNNTNDAEKQIEKNNNENLTKSISDLSKHLDTISSVQKSDTSQSPTSNDNSKNTYAPKSPPQRVHDVARTEKQMVDEIAYEEMESQVFPMTEEQITQLKGKYEKTELAKTISPTPPTPVATSQLVNLSPGSTPPVIRLSQGFVSSLVFLDSTGAPWPISAYDLGDPASFNIQWDKTGNTLMIQATKLYNYGNMAVRLEGLNTPVMLTLVPGQKEIDYRVDMRIQGIGPNAQMPVLGENLPPSANRLLLHVLDGVPPPGSTRLTVSGGDARAWLFKEKMYVRTNLTILSPAWLATMTSADGMHAYEMQKSPVLLVTWHGKVMQLKVEGL
jgi:intracellular multiplication protein IcmK